MLKKMRDMLRFIWKRTIIASWKRPTGARRSMLPGTKKPGSFARPDDAGDGRYRIYAHLSARANTPVIMLTAKVDDADEVLGAGNGRTITSQTVFPVRSVRARVRQCCGGQAGIVSSRCFTAGDLALDRNRRDSQGSRRTGRSDSVRITVCSN